MQPREDVLAFYNVKIGKFKVTYMRLTTLQVAVIDSLISTPQIDYDVGMSCGYSCKYFNCIHILLHDDNANPER